MFRSLKADVRAYSDSARFCRPSLRIVARTVSSARKRSLMSMPTEQFQVCIAQVKDAGHRVDELFREFLLLPHAFFGAMAFGVVARHDDDLLRLVVRPANHAADRFDVNDAAVLVHEPIIGAL